LFLLFRENHFDLIRFNYNKQLVQKTDFKSKILNITKYFTIFNTNKLPAPLHILLLIFGSTFIQLNEKSREDFSFYKNIMYGFLTSIINILKGVNESQIKTFIKIFLNYFPDSKNNINKLKPNKTDIGSDIGPDIGPDIGTDIEYRVTGGQNSYENTLNSKVPIKKSSETSSSKIAYSITIDMELYPGTSLTPQQLKELKCNSKYNAIRKAYAEFTGKPYIIPPVYNKTIKNTEKKGNSKTKKNI
jgi:hypothetical protein